MSLLVVTTMLGCISQPLLPEDMEVAEIMVSPDIVVSQAGRAARFTALSLDAQGNPIPGAEVEWSSLDPSVAVVDPDGTVWSFSSGSTGVEAKSKGRNGKSTAPGQVKKAAAVQVDDPTEPRPETVSNLRVDTVFSGNVHLVFTEVDDGTGQPANYMFRFQVAPLSWPQATHVAFGSCGGQLSGISVGNERVCSVSNLQAGTRYEFQVIAFRGDITQDPVYGDLSAIVGASTPSAPAGLITRHTFEAPLENGWTERGEGNYSNGVLNGDGYGQATYGTNLCVGCGPVQVRRGFDQVDELTVRMRWQVSENMDHRTGSKIKKIFFLENSTTNSIYLALVGDGYQLALITQSTAESASRQQGGPGITPGRIYDVELHIKLNSVDANGNSRPDGIGTVWLDGQRIIHRTDFRFRGEDSPQRDSGKYFSANEGIRGIRWNPTWPNGGDPPAERMWERMYDIGVWSGSGD
ncbi:MAG: Ig-like domain-containing protein [Gemmatimonadota bacterium]